MDSDTIKILIVDDDVQLLAVLESGLSLKMDFEVTATSCANEAVKLIQKQSFDVVVTDYSLNHSEIDGIGILKLVRELQPHCLVIIITAFASLEISLEAIHLGAYDFLTKPFQLDELQLVVRNASYHIELDRENQQLREQMTMLSESLETIQTEHEELMRQIEQWRRPTGMQGAGPVPVMGMGEAGGAPRQNNPDPQIASYVRMSQTIREQLQHERERLDAMFQRGLLSESVYRKALSRHQGEDDKKDANENLDGDGSIIQRLVQEG